MSLDVITFGCRLNAYESEAIRTRAAEDGLQDAVVFNTCAVTAEAVRQARQAIRKARRERPGAKLIVTGCAALVAASRRDLTKRHATMVLDGGELHIEWNADDHVIMTGPAAVDFMGELP